MLLNIKQIDSYTGYNNLSGNNESRYRPVPILCDNGDIFCFSMNPSWGYHYLEVGSNQQHDQSQNAGQLSQNGHYHHGNSWTTSLWL